LGYLLFCLVDWLFSFRVEQATEVRLACLARFH
jgi:hypothetical protein